MSTINHIRTARINTFIGMECSKEHQKKDDEFPGYLRRPKPERIDPYTRRSNICPKCHTSKALLTGECLCD